MAITAHKKVSDIENLMKEEKYAGEEDQALLQQWLDAAEKEVSYADDNMKNLYSEGISSFQSYLPMLYSQKQMSEVKEAVWH